MKWFLKIVLVGVMVFGSVGVTAAEVCWPPFICEKPTYAGRVKYEVYMQRKRLRRRSYRQIGVDTRFLDYYNEVIMHKVEEEIKQRRKEEAKRRAAERKKAMMAAAASGERKPWPPFSGFKTKTEQDREKLGAMGSERFKTFQSMFGDRDSRQIFYRRDPRIKRDIPVTKK